MAREPRPGRRNYTGVVHAADTPSPFRHSGDAAAYRRGVYSPAGIAALGVVGLWLAYLVPHRLRHRQQLLESRTDDRYSGSMRVLAVADGKADRHRTQAVRPPSGTAILTPVRGTRIIAAPAGGATGGGNMDRPHESHEKRVIDAARRIAQRHAQRAALLARRRASARRRLVLVLALLALTAGGWTAVGIGVLGAAIAAVPSVLLVATLALGRAAVVSAQRGDAAWQREEAALARAARPVARGAGPVATGRAVRGSDDDTLVIEKVVDVATPATSADDGASWQPVPVPRPTYTLKSPAPRWEPAPLEIPERTAAPAAAARGEGELAGGLTTGVGDEAAHAERPAASLDLDAILARRRAVGE